MPDTEPTVDRTPAAGHRRQCRAFVALVLFIVVALIAAACGDAREEDDDGSGKSDSNEKPTVGGQVIFALEDEPASLNVYTSSGFSPQTQIILSPVLGQLTVLSPDGDYVPELLADEPEVVSEDPQKVRYTLREDAVWEDGSPITSADVQFTLDQILSSRNDISDRVGYDKIKDGKLVDVSEDGRTFSIEFSEQYAPWRRLFSVGAPILKKAAMEGQDFNNYFNDGVPFASGPFRIESWTKGSDVALVRNEAYRDDHPAYLDRVAFKFVASKELMAEALGNGEIDVAYEITQPEIAGLVRDLPQVDIQVTAGPIWEHLDFNLRDPLLQLKEVRQALAYAIDRDQVVDAVVRPIDGDAVVLQNVFYMNNQSDYKENWVTYSRDVAKVDQFLGDAGFAKGPDGIFTRGTTRLSLTLLTTTGNPLREQTGQLLEEQLATAGIDLVTEAVPTEEFLDRVANCEYQVALFAYQADPDPSTANAIYRADSMTCPGEDQNVEGQNSTAYRNIEITELLTRTDQQLNAKRRARLYNEVDKLLAKDVPTLPLYQRSTVLAYDADIRNVQGNATLQGPTWNLGEWWFKAEPPPSKKPATTPPPPTS